MRSVVSNEYLLREIKMVVNQVIYLPLCYMEVGFPCVKKNITVNLMQWKSSS